MTRRAGEIELLLLPLAAIAALQVLQGNLLIDFADEGFLWHGAQRLAAGEVPIRDFRAYDPARYAWSAAVFALLGDDGLHEQRLANLALGWLGLVAIHVTMRRARMGFAIRIAATIVLALWFGFPRHKTLEQALTLILVAAVFHVLAAPTARRWFGGGVALGLMVAIGRNHALYWALAGALTMTHLAFTGWRPTRRDVAAVTLGTTLGLAPMLALVILVPGFATAYWGSIAELLAGGGRLPLPYPWPWTIADPTPHAVAVSIAFIVVPAGYVAVLIHCRRRAADDPFARLALAAAIAGLAYLHHGIDRADWGHLAQVMPPWVVMMAALAAGFAPRNRYLAGACLAGIVAATGACLAPSLPVIRHARAVIAGAIEPVLIHGRPFMAQRGQARLIAAIAALHRGCGAPARGVFIAPHWPMIHGILGTMAPGGEMFFLFPRSVAWQQRQIEALASSGPVLAIIDTRATIDGDEASRFDRRYPVIWNHLRAAMRETAAPGLPRGVVALIDPTRCAAGG